MAALSSYVLVAMFIFIFLLIAGPLLYGRLRVVLGAMWRKIQHNCYVTQSTVAHPAPETTHTLSWDSICHPMAARSLLQMSRQALKVPLIFFRPATRRRTDPVIPLASESVLTVTSKVSTESVLTERALGLIGPYTSNSRRLRRQGWLMHLSSGRDSPSEETLSPPPSSLATNIVLRDVGNTCHEANGAESIFSPQLVELCADGSHTPIIPPISSLHSSPILPVLLMTAAFKKISTMEIECNPPVHFESPLGPPSLFLVLPDELECSLGDEAGTVTIHPEDSKGHDDISLSSSLLDEFPQPPDTAKEKSSFIAIGKETPSNQFKPQTLRQESKQVTVGQKVPSDPQNRVASNNDCECIKSSQSEIIFRAGIGSVCGGVQRSLSMPFGIVPTELNAKGLGFLQSYHHFNLAVRG